MTRLDLAPLEAMARVLEATQGLPAPVQFAVGTFLEFYCRPLIVRDADGVPLQAKGDTTK